MAFEMVLQSAVSMLHIIVALGCVALAMFALGIGGWELLKLAACDHARTM